MILLLNFVSVFLSLIGRSFGSALPPNEKQCNCSEDQLCLPAEWSELLPMDQFTCVNKSRVCEHLWGRQSQRRHKKSLRKARSVSSHSFKHTKMCQQLKRTYVPLKEEDQPCLLHMDLLFLRQIETMTLFGDDYEYQCDSWLPECTDDGNYAPKQLLSNDDEATAWCVHPDGTPTCNKDCLMR